MAKPLKKKSQLQQEQPAPGPVPVPAKKKKAKKKKRPAVRKQKPLPPPLDPYEQAARDLGLPILTTADSPRAAKARAGQSPVPVIISGDPFDLGPTFDGRASARPSGNSSTSGEPKPGQPLSAEQERTLREGFDEIGVEDHAPDPAAAAPRSSDGAAVADMLPEITFDPSDVQDVLREGFHWVADRFDSAHWELTESQARMLGKPTAQLLSTLYSRLPDFLTRWCDSTPGLAGLCVTGAIVIGPKVAQQVAISRERRKTLKPVNRPPQTVPIPRRPPPGPVGEIHEVEPINQ